MPRNDNDGEMGPLPYVNLGATVAKFRRLANLRQLTKEERQAHGEAVEIAIRAAHRKALLGTISELPPPKRVTLTPISRLFHYDKPIPMKGDPPWSLSGDPWDNRQRAIMDRSCPAAK